MKTNGSGAPGTTLRDWAIRLGVAVLAAVITAIVGPFSTYEQFSFLERLLYWGGLIIGLVFPAFLIRLATYRLLRGSPLSQDLISAAVLAFTIGPVVWTFNHVVMGFDVSTPRIVLEHIGVAALICLVPVAIRAYLRIRLVELQAQATPDVVPPMTEAQAAFIRRLEPDRRGYVVRVSADNHQVSVWTDKGETKLRLRFGDALDELTEFDGTRIHRSHWVAYDAIGAIIPEGRRHSVRLHCGSLLPVSQTGLKALQDAGVGVES